MTDPWPTPGTMTSECSRCHWWVDFVGYIWSKGPCCTSLSGLLCTNIKTDDTHLISLRGSRVQLSWLAANMMCLQNQPPWKTETLTLEWVSLSRDSPHLSLSFAARGKAHPVWPWMRLVLDLCRLPDAYLFPAAFVFFIVTNFSHEHNLLSLVSPPSKITKLGWLWEYQNRGMYDWIGGWESTASIKNPLLTVWCKCLLTFSYAYTNTYSYCYQNSYYNHTYQLLTLFWKPFHTTAYRFISLSVCKIQS